MSFFLNAPRPALAELFTPRVGSGQVADLKLTNTGRLLSLRAQFCGFLQLNVKQKTCTNNFFSAQAYRQETAERPIRQTTEQGLRRSPSAATNVFDLP